MQLRQGYNMPDSGRACSLDKAELLFFYPLGRARHQKCGFNACQGAIDAGAIVEIPRSEFYILQRVALPARSRASHGANCYAESQ
jgi:hypothetical protein